MFIAFEDMWTHEMCAVAYTALEGIYCRRHARLSRNSVWVLRDESVLDQDAVTKVELLPVSGERAYILFATPSRKAAESFLWAAINRVTACREAGTVCDLTQLQHEYLTDMPAVISLEARHEP